MLLWTTLKVGIKSLWAAKTRSILAMLGIIIGVAAVIAMLALGRGAEKQMLDNFATMGSNLLFVQPGQSGSHGVASGTQQNLTLEDAKALLDVPGVRAVTPAVSRDAQVKYSSKNMRCPIYGGSVTYFPIRNFEVERGRKFTEAEVDNTARVAVIGPGVVEKLFGLNDPLDEVIKVNGVNFTVIGVTKAKGSQGWFNPDEMLIVPYTTAMKQLFGLKYLREINIQAEDGSDSAKVQEALTQVLRKRHRIQSDADDDFTIRNQADWIRMASTATDTFKYLLGGVASVSLLVGGIGIMNIMLVTVTERTREIGVRKAIGAKERHILVQFLVEAVIISGLGGLLGVALGVGTAKVFPLFMPIPAVVEVWAVFLSLGFSAGVGIAFGLYPAWRASSLDPVEALRYE